MDGLITLCLSVCVVVCVCADIGCGEVAMSRRTVWCGVVYG